MFGKMFILVKYSLTIVFFVSSTHNIISILYNFTIDNLDHTQCTKPSFRAIISDESSILTFLTCTIFTWVTSVTKFNDIKHGHISMVNIGK